MDSFRLKSVSILSYPVSDEELVTLGGVGIGIPNPRGTGLIADEIISIA